MKMHGFVMIFVQFSIDVKAHPQGPPPLWVGRVFENAWVCYDFHMFIEKVKKS